MALPTDVAGPAKSSDGPLTSEIRGIASVVVPCMDPQSTQTAISPWPVI
ncbi:MAG: hypothetical protein RXR18_06290 [Nitrososphaeria archaeon]